MGERKIPNSPIPPPANTVDPCLLLSKLHQEPSEISLKGAVKHALGFVTYFRQSSSRLFVILAGAQLEESLETQASMYFHLC